METVATATERRMTMDVREKLIEILRKPIFPHELVDPTEAVADYLLDSGVTVQEWISVDDRLPQYTDEYNVTVGVPSEFGYFEKVKTLRFERIKGKEPRWIIPKNEIYNVIAWMELPKKYQPPKGE